MGRDISKIVAAVDNNLILDDTLKSGTFLRDSRGMLNRKVRGFSIVFTFIQSSEKWAIRCWHTPINNIQSHYTKLCTFLKGVQLPYFLPITYINNGLLVEGEILPITQMKWINGTTLNEYIACHKNNKTKMHRLADDFLSLCKSMHYHHIAHGDLQHGNIMIDENESMYLVDYDSIYSPNMGSDKVDEITGLKDYQHPARQKNKFANEKLDYFSELIIFLSIVSIAEQPSLADKYQITSAERMLFAAKDFSNLKNSNIYNDIVSLGEDFILLLNILESYLSEDNILDLQPFELYLDNSKFNNPASMHVESQEEKDEKAWQLALKHSSLEAFKIYLQHYPKGRHRIAAQNRIYKLLEAEEKLWIETITINSIESYINYLKNSYQKTHIVEADRAIHSLLQQKDQANEEQLWDDAIKKHSINSYQTYLSKSTLHIYDQKAQEAISLLKSQAQQKAEDDFWALTKKLDTLEAYQKYLKESILKSYTTDATNRIRIIEESHWKETNKTGSIDAYNEYIKLFPIGRYVNEAKKAIVKIRKKTKLRKIAIWVIVISGFLFVLCILFKQSPYIPGKEQVSSQRVTPKVSSSPLVIIDKDKELVKEMEMMEKYLRALELTKANGNQLNKEMLQKAIQLLDQLKDSSKYNHYRQRLNILQQ